MSPGTLQYDGRLYYFILIGPDAGFLFAGFLWLCFWEGELSGFRRDVFNRSLRATQNTKNEINQIVMCTFNMAHK